MGVHPLQYRVLFLWITTGKHQIFAAVDHVMPYLFAPSLPDELADDADHLLRVFEERRSHVLTHRFEETGRLYFEFDGGDVSHQLFEPVYFEIDLHSETAFVGLSLIQLIKLVQHLAIDGYHCRLCCSTENGVGIDCKLIFHNFDYFLVNRHDGNIERVLWVYLLLEGYHSLHYLAALATEQLSSIF